MLLYFLVQTDIKRAEIGACQRPVSPRAIDPQYKKQEELPWILLKTIIALFLSSENISENK